MGRMRGLMRYAELTRDQAEMWWASAARRENGKRTALREEWARYYRLLEKNHRTLAKENAAKARELECRYSIVGLGGGGS
jgi:hypothetical protein